MIGAGNMRDVCGVNNNISNADVSSMMIIYL